MKRNLKKRIMAAGIAAALLSASITAFAAGDTVLFEENFDGYAAEGENLIGKLIRTTDKLNTNFPDDIWSVNAVKYTGGNSVTEPVAFTHSPYGAENDYCAYYYSPSTATGTCWDQLIYTFGNVLQDGDTLILEGKIKNTPYYQNGAASGNFANGFELGFGGTGGYKTIFAIDSGVTLGTSGKDWGLYNLAGDWIHFSLSITLNGSNMASCPVNLTLSGYTIENNPADYTRSGVANLSQFGTPENINSVRHRGVIQASNNMDNPGSTIDTQRHGIYFDNAKIIKAGDFEMSLGEVTDYSELDLSFSHSFNTKLDDSGGFLNIGTESFKVTDGNGTEIPVSAVEYSVIDPDHATLTLDESALEPNTTYTVTSTVKDVLGNTPSDVSFTTPAATAEISAVSAPEKFIDETSVAYAYGFSVKPNGNTITGIKVSSDTAGSAQKNLDIPNTESEVKFGIIAVHELSGDESADSVAAPEFTAEIIK